MQGSDFHLLIVYSTSRLSVGSYMIRNDIDHRAVLYQRLGGDDYLIESAS